MLNMRNSGRRDKTRKIAISKDGGKTWKNMGTDTVLIEPICQGSLLSYQPPSKKRFLFFSNPANKMSRSNLTLRLSLNDGKTWAASQVIYPGPSAYSDIAVINDTQIACFYEAGITRPYEGIAFQSVNINNLLKP